MTGATIFTGFGGADLGMIRAGIEMLWGIEYDAKIAEVARANGIPASTADLLDSDPKSFERVDCLHASPPCPSFSVAKAGRRETDYDRALATRTAEFIRVLRPKIFTLENVWGYRHSDSWQIIMRALSQAGYAWNCWRLCAADYGVPQTRWRMIVAAVHSSKRRPAKPPPTHAENPPAPGLFGDMLPAWQGWYKAVEDQLPALPNSSLAPYQIEILPPFMDCGAFLCTPGHTIPYCLFRRAHEPAFTVTATVNDKRLQRAILIGNGAWHGQVVYAEKDQLAFTITTKSFGRLRAIIDSRIVNLSPHCQARFQSFPDTYELPEQITLAAKGIGNAVPPILIRRLYEHLFRQEGIAL